MKSSDDPHMHEIAYRFVSDDHLWPVWTMSQDGQPSGKAELDLHRCH